MQNIGVWHVASDGPRRLAPSSVDLEISLETWIEANPELLEAGLLIVGRQVHVEGGLLDLLAIDPQGRWVVIEIKRGAVRRDTVAQVLDYASCIATMPFELLAQRVDPYLAGKGSTETLEAILGERLGTTAVQDEPRSIVMFVVGTGRDPGLDRMVQYLAGGFGMPIRVASYTVFETEPGRQFLVRELSETEFAPTATPKLSTVTVEQVCMLADTSGIGPQFRAVLEAATGLGLYPRVNKSSIMYAPPANRTRCLFTMWANPDKSTGRVGLYVAAEAFAQFYGLTEEQVTAELGPNGWLYLAPSAVGGFVEGLRRLFNQVELTQ